MKVLWFSRHGMTAEQKAALGDAVEITQVSKTVSSAKEVQAEIDAADIVAIVAPIGLQAEFLKLAGSKPVITALSERILIPGEAGEEDKVEFRFVKWERILKIEIIKEDFVR